MKFLIWIAVLGSVALDTVRAGCIMNRVPSDMSSDSSCELNYLCTQHIYISSMHNDPYEIRTCRNRGIEIKYDIKIENYADSVMQENFDSFDNSYNILGISERAGIVNSLDFSLNGLTYIPPIILDFENLLRLNISHNNVLHIEFTKFTRLIKLNYLDMSYNHINILDYDITEPEMHDVLAFSQLKSLNLQHNYITIIGGDFFHNFNSLEWLDLSYNNLTTLESTTFEGLTKMSYLDLSNNEITTLNFALLRFSALIELYIDNNKISELHEFDFKGLKNLRQLTIRNNVIHSMGKDLFSSLKSLEKLDLNHNQISKIIKGCFDVCEKLTELDLSSNKIIKIDVGSFRNNIKMIILNFEGNKLEGTIEKGLFEGLEKLTSLNLSYHDVTKLDNFAFFGTRTLSDLNLSYNRIVDISNSALKLLNNLGVLNLQNNLIQNISFDSSDLNRLTWLSLKNNKVSVISTSTIDNMISLEYLDLSENRIVTLGKELFASLQNLKHFYIAQNPLSGQIESKTFRNLQALPELDLSYTNISEVNNGSFLGMSSLFYLNISHSSLIEVDYNAFSETGNIHVLDLSYNSIAIFMVNTSHIERIEELILKHNLIHHINFSSLQNLCNLSKIDLSYNKIINIGEKGISNLYKLEELNIDYNEEADFSLSSFINLPALKQLSLCGIHNNFDFALFAKNKITLYVLRLSSAAIKDIDSLHLSGVPNLKSLDLSLNKISTITNDALKNLMEMERLTLKSNAITFIQPGSFKNTGLLVQLDLSYNILSYIPYGAFAGLKNLEILDLSHNKIHEITTHRLHGMPLLTYLILDSNAISELNFNELSTTSIARLSIGDNNLLSCSMIADYNNNRKGLPELTALTLRDNIENIEGIPCKHRNNLENYISNSNGSLNKLLYDKNDMENHILSDIKSILTNLSLHGNFASNPNNLMSNISVILEKRTNEITAQLKSLSDISAREEQMQSKIYEEIKKDKIIEHSDKNYDKTVTKDANVNEIEKTPILLNNNDNKYIETIRDDFKEYVTKERKNIVNEMKILSESMRYVLETLANNNVSSIPRSDALLANHDTTQSNKFTEACVGLILVIIITFVAFYFYKSREVLPKMRSSSTQQIYTSIEM